MLHVLEKWELRTKYGRVNFEGRKIQQGYLDINSRTSDYELENCAVAGQTGLN
jgi:hypothetical protein